ncbi:hypothetical protein EXIGLDRAFT_298753 [Exidia glandulosa HHB12029]|uniref:Uncharacterized protein n=1 Tax=Exidia glandulosa HHB12029 TaxID=1314781 RepID=A0A165LZW6_EXIGL|nr:hypothetical protein EXIGLDRAFT_298753 [Exidia glandulosa HHB12029]
MINWHDPAVELQVGHTALYLVNLCAGWYLWEFCVSFGFDWEHLMFRRPFRWTLIPYFGTRYACLLSVLVSMRISNVIYPINNCTTWWLIIMGTAHTAIALASLLLGLRVVALAQQKLLVGIFLGTLWLGVVGTLVHGAVLIEATYVPQLLACGVTRSEQTRVNFLATSIFDCICLILMFLLLQRARGSGLWKLLLSQGVLYFVVVIAAYVPATVLLMLNLNGGMNEVLQPVTRT